MNILESLGIVEVNPGACTGMDAWLPTADAGVLSSLSPASGQRIASVTVGSVSDYETVIERPTTAFKTWRQVPAPRRGEMIRRMADTR